MHRERHSSGTDRAQTAQDFAVGIGLFLLSVAFVFAFVPFVVSPYDAGTGAAEASQADRAATVVLGNISMDERPNEVDVDAGEQYFDSIEDDGELRNRTGLPFTARINVTVTNVETETRLQTNGVTWTAGNTHRDRFGGTSYTRIVRADDPNLCEPACRLVVTVW